MDFQFFMREVYKNNSVPDIQHKSNVDYMGYLRVCDLQLENHRYLVLATEAVLNSTIPSLGLGSPQAVLLMELWMVAQCDVWC